MERTLFGGITRDFGRDIPGAPAKFEKHTFVFNFCPLTLSHSFRKVSHYDRDSGTGVSGRPGHRTMEINGKSTVSYLVHPSRTLLYAYFNRSGSKEPYSNQARRGIAPLYGGTFARSYSVSREVSHYVPLGNKSPEIWAIVASRALE